MALTKVVGGVIADSSITSTDILDSTITNAKMAVDPSNASNLSSGDVPAAQLDNVPTEGLDTDIALLAFKTQANGNLARYNLVDQSVDAFEDASGIDASASTNEVRNSAGKYYSGSSTVGATGGTITTDGDYTIHSFSEAQSGTDYVTDTTQTVDYLIVGAGGGGGAGNGGPGDPGGYRSGGGGGAGGYRSYTGVSLAAGTYAVTVGAGGAGGPGSGSSAGRNGTVGGNSVFNSITSTGGGYGGAGTGQAAWSGGAGGSGGGGSADLASANAGGAASPTTSPAQGYVGTGGTSNEGGAGGGAGEAGGTDGPMLGGDGLANSITGASVTYAGGGSGGSDGLSPGGAGGGGSGPGSGNGGAGTDGLGGGGGGAGNSEGGATPDGGVGGDGIVIIRRPTGTQYLNMTLQSNAFTAETAPTKGDLVFTYTDGAGTAVLGTNITVEYSADNGSTWTDFGIGASDSQGTTGGHTIVTKNNVALTSTSGTSMRWRLKTLVQSISIQTRIHAVSLGWS